MSEFTIVSGYTGPRVFGKLGKQRKARAYSVNPASDGTVYVQADGAIGKFDPATGKGKLNIKGEYFPHLSYVLGAVDYEFPPDFVALAMEVCPEPGSETHVGGGVFVNTIQVI